MTTDQLDMTGESGGDATEVSGYSPQRGARRGHAWLRFALLVVITGVVLVPVGAVVLLAFGSGVGGSNGHSFPTFANFTQMFKNTDILRWLENSLLVTGATVIASVAIAAPAGYVVSRSRARLVGWYSLGLFLLQALPVITAVIPLFILFSKVQLVDSLSGLAIVYVGQAVSVAIWMMAAYMDSIPGSLEEAAWIDGSSVFGGFARIVLPNSLPGILSTAIFTFLVAWGDYLVVTVFIRTSSRYTLPLGIETFFAHSITDWGGVMAASVVMMLPVVIIFTALNRFFSIGGIGGSLAGQ